MSERTIIDKVKTALRTVTTDAGLVDEITDLIASAKADLELAGIYLPTNADNDPLIRKAIITYCRMHFGSPEEYERLKSSYDEQKAQLQTSQNYGG